MDNKDFIRKLSSHINIEELKAYININTLKPLLNRMENGKYCEIIKGMNDDYFVFTEINEHYSLTIIKSISEGQVVYATLSTHDIILQQNVFQYDLKKESFDVKSRVFMDFTNNKFGVFVETRVDKVFIFPYEDKEAEESLKRLVLLEEIDAVLESLKIIDKKLSSKVSNQLFELSNGNEHNKIVNARNKGILVEIEVDDNLLNFNKLSVSKAN